MVGPFLGATMLTCGIATPRGSDGDMPRLGMWHCDTLPALGCTAGAGAGREYRLRVVSHERVSITLTPSRKGGPRCRRQRGFFSSLPGCLEHPQRGHPRRTTALREAHRYEPREPF